jgi:hypothetical protein
MSTVNSMRTGIHTAIAALSGLGTIQRYDALRVEDALDVAKRRPAIVVVYQGRAKGNGPLSQRTKNTIRYRWTTVIVAENWRDGVSALSEATYGAEAISDALDGIRDVEIHTIDSEPVYLRLLDESVTAPPDRPVDGGPAMYVINWETTEVLA